MTTYITRNNYERFLILLWKNLFVIWNRKTRLFFIITVPLYLCFLLVFIRMLVKLEKSPEVKYKHIDLDRSWNAMQKQLTIRRNLHISNG